MSGIRVKDLPSECIEKDIKIFFSKPENCGGPIEEIYFPLFKGHAVVIFKNSDTADKVIKCGTHHIQGNEIRVEQIPFPQVFSTLEAKFDPTVAALIQATEQIKDEIQYNKNIELLYDETQCLTGVRGTWYILEWVWTYIEHISRQQKNARRRSKPLGHHLKEPRSPSPMDTAEPIISMPSSTKTEKDKTTAEKVEDSFKNKAKSNEPKKAPLAATEGECHSKENIRSVKDDSEKETLIDHKTVERMADLKISKVTEKVNDITILSDKADIQTIEFQYGPLTIRIYTGMITLAETDAIVNAANGRLAHFGGVADAIAQVAGKEMQRECDEYVQNNGGVPTTKVMHTSAGGKFSHNVKYVMHAVGPMCSLTRPEKDAAQLTQTFLNSMKYGNDVLKINSMTMPAISSGVFGCPLEMCVRSFINAVLLFANDHIGDTVHLQEVHLVNNDENKTALTVMQLREVISQGTKKLVSEAQQQIQRAEEEDITYRYLPITSSEADFRPTSDETRRGIYYSAGTQSERFSTSPALDYQRNAETRSRNTRLETEDRPKKHETDTYMTSDHQSDVGAYSSIAKDRMRAFEVSRQPVAGRADMFDATSRFVSISRNNYPLSSSESSRYSNPYVPYVGKSTPDEIQKRSVTSPGSSKPGPPTSSLLYGKDTLGHLGGNASYKTKKY